MELASMLAGERFSDHPLSVCPVIGSLLRAHNDAVGDERRQDLYAYAAKVVGSRSPGAAQEARAARLTAWTREVERRQSAAAHLPVAMRLLSRLLKAIVVETHTHAFYRLTEHNVETHAEVLALYGVVGEKVMALLAHVGSRMIWQLSGSMQAAIDAYSEMKRRAASRKRKR